jgi:hypothetical protein
MSTKALEAIEQIWPNGGSDWRRNGASPPADVLTQLRKSFSEDELREAVTRFLLDAAGTYEQLGAPTKRESHLAGCCVELIASENGIQVDPRLLQRILTTFPASIWYEPFRRIVPLLSRTQFLQGLLTGVQENRDPDLIYNSVAALHLFHKLPKREDDPEELKKTLAAVDTRLAELTQRPHKDISERAIRVRKVLPSFADRSD